MGYEEIGDRPKMFDLPKKVFKVQVKQFGIKKVVRVRTVQNGDIKPGRCEMCNLEIKDCFCHNTL